MDMLLNISTAPVAKKASNKPVNVNVNKKPTNQSNKNVSNKNNTSNPSFQFKWDSSKNAKPAYVNRKAQKTNKISPQINPNKPKEIPKPKINETSKPKTNEASKPKTNEASKPKTNEPSKTNEVESEESSEDEPTKTQPQPQQPFKRKVFPLFDKFSEAAKGHTYENIKGKSSVEQVFSTKGSTFKDLNIHAHMVTNLERIGHKTLTAVQERAIPEAMQGKNVFVRSQTGSGKTLTYAIPIVESLRRIEPHINRKDGVQALVVVPTRELALQTYELFMKLVEAYRWIVPGILCGGENRNSEKARIRKGISILVGTPGRILDHVLHTSSLRLDKIRCLVLDEADRLLDMGFQKDVSKLVEQIDESKNMDYDPIALMKSRGRPLNLETPEPKKENYLTNINSKERQTILLSATLTSNVKDLATFTMKDYVYIDPLNTDPNIDLNEILSEHGTEVVVPESVIQQFVVTDVKTRLVVLASFIVHKAKEKNCKMFVFMASRPMVEFHELLFKKCLIKRPKKETKKVNNVMISMDEDETDDDDDLDDGETEEENILDLEIFKLHGSMDQKERTTIFKAFRAAKKGVLLCTDVAARGVDIPHADYVIQYTGPLQDDDYIHRVGRTGRVGQKGLALLFLTEPELEYIQHLKEKNIFLKREQQDNILKHLISFMDHMSPGSVQAAAEILQRRFEKAVIADKNLQKAANFAYSTWSRYYSSYPISLRKYFDIKKAHLGHYVTSFALRNSPQQVGKFIRQEVGKTEDKRLNKKLDNHESEAKKVVKPLRQKKRPRSQELMMSEFDSGLAPIKKKKKSK